MIEDDAVFYDKMWLRSDCRRNVSPTLRRRQIIRFIRRHTDDLNHRKASLRLLDLGCGAGCLIRHLATFGTVTGVDVASETMARNQRQFPGAKFYAADATDSLLPQRIGKFDVVVCSEVIEHVQLHSRNQLLRNIVALLEPGGLAVLSTPDRSVVYNRRFPNEDEDEFLLRIDPQPLNNMITEEELFVAIKPFFSIIEFTTVQPYVKNRVLDLIWKGLFWPIDYRFVNTISQGRGLRGEYMVVALSPNAITAGARTQLEVHSD